MDFEIITNSPEETIALGRKIGSLLTGGQVISLVGNLGTGKTHLIKGIVAGAGDEHIEQVNSPTFVLVNEYHGRLEIYHIDAYRLDDEAQFEDLGFDDMCHPGSIVLIEWADKVRNVLAGVNLISVELFHCGQTQRQIKICNLPQMEI